MAKIITKYEFAGTGCLVQGIGLVLMLFWPIGTIAGVGLLIFGSIMSKRLYCGNCKNKIDNKNVTMCPVCKETVQ
jgi:Na+-transporting NADH:ubiquinone oxidoreductase subunit NqrB